MPVNITNHKYGRTQLYTTNHCADVGFIVGIIATLGPGERPILSQRNRMLGQREVSYFQQASQTAYLGSYLYICIRSSSNFKLKLRGPNQNLILFEMKKTSNGRQPQHYLKRGFTKNFKILSGIRTIWEVKTSFENQHTVSGVSTSPNCEERERGHPFLVKPMALEWIRKVRMNTSSSRK